MVKNEQRSKEIEQTWGLLDGTALHPRASIKAPSPTLPQINPSSPSSDLRSFLSGSRLQKDYFFTKNHDLSFKKTNFILMFFGNLAHLEAKASMELLCSLSGSFLPLLMFTPGAVGEKAKLQF